jgi:outer membrane receptor protein involved in Fe transport
MCMFLRRPVDSFPLKTTELWLCAFMVFLFFSSSTPAFAEEPVTEEQGFIEIGDVFAAAKHHQSIQEAPASITIVTDEDIRRYGHRQLKDVVNSVRGFYTYSDRNYEFIGVRGFARLGDYGNRVLQLIDGHTNNENIYGSFFLGQDFGVDMDLVKKIEFIRGPGSALYGSNALFGTVNVITRDGRDVGGLSATVEAGSLNTRGGAITYGNEYENGLDLLVSASVLNSGGADLFFPEFSNPAVSDGWARDADGEKARKFLLKATFGEVSLLAGEAQPDGRLRDHLQRQPLQIDRPEGVCRGEMGAFPRRRPTSEDKVILRSLSL